MDPILVGLFGTIGQNQWRESFTSKLLEAGIAKASIFNPINEPTSAIEKAKAEAKYAVYVISAPLVDKLPLSLQERMPQTVVVFDQAAFPGPLAQAMHDCEVKLKAHYPQGNFFTSIPDAEGWLVKQLVGKSRAAND
jgi:hypothetical protein